MSQPKKTPPPTYAGKRVLIVGLGFHGGAVGAIRWFLRQGATIRVTDDKTAADLSSSMKLLRRQPIVYHLGGLHLSDIRWADIVYQNQAVPSSSPIIQAAQRRGVPVVNETTIFFERCPAKIIGVTGTRGKSTTTALTRHILAGRFSRVIQTGNIRQKSMLEVLDSIRSADLVVAELSSFQLEYLPYVHRSPAIAVMTNISPDHLNRHGSMSAYVAAKTQILRWQTKNDVAIVNADNAWTRAAAKKTAGRVAWFSAAGKASASVTLRGGWIFVHGRRLLTVSRLPLAGRHNQENILAAITVAVELGVPVTTIRHGNSVAEFPGQKIVAVVLLVSQFDKITMAASDMNNLTKTNEAVGG